MEMIRGFEPADYAKMSEKIGYLDFAISEYRRAVRCLMDDYFRKMHIVEE
jgi:hypothetical protein